MIVELKSVASVIDTQTKIVYPSYQMGGYDKLSGKHLDDLPKSFVDEMSEADITLINELFNKNNMKKFDFFLDQKITTWMRTEFEVEAENLNDAAEIAKRMFDKGDLENIEWEEIMDTKEVLQPSDNDGESTAEIYNMNEKGEVLEVYNNKVDKVEKF